MASGNTLTTLDALLKDYYDGQPLVNETYRDKPLWALLSKQRAKGNITGRDFIHPVVYGTSQGRNTNFALAQSLSQTTSELSAKFAVSRVQNYQLATVDTITTLAMDDDKGAFIDAVALILDNCLENLGQDLAISAYGDGSGSRGQISSGTTLASSTLSFAVPDQVLNFRVGMQLQLAQTPTSSVRAFGSNGTGLIVGKVDELNGAITIVNPSGTPVNITDATYGCPTAVVGDSIFVVNDQGNKMLGLSAWIPYGGPASNDNFLGVNRSVDPVRLAGQWLDGSQMSMEDIVIQATVNVKKQANGKLTHFFVPFNKYAQLLKSQTAKTVVVNEVSPDISFQGLRVLTPSGEVEVIGDPQCPPDRIFGVNIDTWVYTHVADPVQLYQQDGLSWLRQATADGMEARFFSFGNLVCRKPDSNIIIKVQP